MPDSNGRTIKRRVPEALRRRTLVSCDRCKAKRSRCVRLGESEPCASCLASGVKCESTIPRKQRVYGSIESLSLRYRVLDILVKGLFPNEDTNDINTLLRLADERQITLPPNIEDGSDQSNSTNPASGISDHKPRNRSDAKTKSSSSEKMIPAPHGVPHYIGPASSFQFATAIRRLVSKYNTTIDSLADEGNGRSLRTDFADMKISIALEPRVHPATTGSEDTEDDNTNKRSDEGHRLAFRHDTPSVTSPNSSIYTRTVYMMDILPTRELADELVQAFFDCTHPNYAIFHRGMFQAQYENVWQDDQDPPDPGWICSLLMVLAFGAQVLEGRSPDEAIAIQKRSLKTVRDRFHRLAFTASLTNVQALLLLQLFEHNAGERNTAWLHLGLAARMAIALGMHRESTSSIFGPIERNIRKIVWFTLYTFESSLSLALGRPSTIDADDTNTGLPDQSLMDGGDYPLKYMHHAVILTEISNLIRRFVSVASAKLSDGTQSWIDGLPLHLTSGHQTALPRHRRAVLLMHIYCQHLRSIVGRCYLVYNVNWHIDSSTGMENANPIPIDARIVSLGLQCSESALIVVDHLQQMAKEDLLDGVTWLDFYYVYHNLLVASLTVFWQHYNLDILGASNSVYVSSIHSMIQMCYQSRLAPTYQILLRVAFQFAHIVGINLDDSMLLQDPRHDDTTSKIPAASAHDPMPNATQPDAQIMPWFADDELFAPFQDPSGLYFGGNNNLDLEVFAFGGEMGLQEPNNNQYPPPAQTYGEPGLMVYGQSNPWHS